MRFGRETEEGISFVVGKHVRHGSGNPTSADCERKLKSGDCPSICGVGRREFHYRMLDGGGEADWVPYAIDVRSLVRTGDFKVGIRSWKRISGSKLKNFFLCRISIGRVFTEIRADKVSSTGAGRQVARAEIAQRPLHQKSSAARNSKTTRHTEIFQKGDLFSF